MQSLELRAACRRSRRRDRRRRRAGMIVALSASQSRAADSTSVSSTVCRSKVERLMTLSTSAVAVCCSSDSLRSSVRWRSSLNSRVFSMAMTAWAAKFVHQLDLLVGERAHLLAVDGDGADQLAVLAASARRACVRAPPIGQCCAMPSAIGRRPRCRRSGNVDLADRSSAADRQSGVDRMRSRSLIAWRCRIASCAATPDDRRRRGSTRCRTWPRRCASRSPASRRTPAAARPASWLMTFSTSRGRGLLLQRFGEIVGALAQFVEQPRVLDGDHGLGGEGLHQLDLLVGERLAPRCAVDDDSADQLVVLEHQGTPSNRARIRRRSLARGPVIPDRARTSWTWTTLPSSAWPGRRRCCRRWPQRMRSRAVRSKLGSAADGRGDVRNARPSQRKIDAKCRRRRAARQSRSMRVEHRLQVAGRAG